ncbi:LIC12162 family protein [Desulfovibrio sp. 86]|nr:LIC12162 family protein [Desulfovibrio sp. 86]
MDFDASVPGHALGPWCYASITDYNTLASLVDSSLLPPPYSHFSESIHQMDYVRDCTTRAALRIGDYLNNKHNTNFSNFFWAFTQRGWIGHIAGCLYDYYLRVNKISKLDMSYEYSGIELTEARPSTVQHLVICLKRSQSLTAWLASETLDYLAPDNCQKKQTVSCRLPQSDHTSQFEALPLAQLQLPTSPLHTITSWIKRFFHISQYPDMMLHNYQLGNGKIFLIHWLTSRKKSRSSISHFSKKNMVNRLTATKNSFEDERFENLLFKTAVKLIPNIYWDFDAFGQVLEDVNSAIKKSTNKKILFPTPGLIYDEKAEIFCALKKEQDNALIVMAQHGSFYGTLKKYQFIEQEEFEKSDIYCTWGWSTVEDVENNFYPLPVFFSKQRTARSEHDDGSILFVVDDEMVNFHRIRSGGYYSDQHIALLRQKFDFFGTFDNTLRKNIIYQAYPASSPTLQTHAFLEQTFPELKITNQSFQEHFKRCRLVVMPYPGTTMHFALAANIPTILFWEKDFFVFSRQFQHIADCMHECGLLFYNPVDAARAVETIYNDPEKWMRDRDRRACVKLFQRHYAWTEKNSVPYYKSFLNDVKKFYRATTCNLK